jgi:hypothetical protein
MCKNNYNDSQAVDKPVDQTGKMKHIVAVYSSIL